MRKQAQVLASGETHLLEIDLLRVGTHTLAVPEPIVRSFGPFDYLLCLHDATRPRHYLFWRNALRQPLPALLLPLRTTENEEAPSPPVRVDLQAVFTRCYDESRLDAAIAYEREPTPPLLANDALWAAQLLHEKSLR